MQETRTLHESLTNLLMDNGASVTKKSIDALIEYIRHRDEHIFSGAQDLLETFHNQMKFQTEVNDLVASDTKVSTDAANPPQKATLKANKGKSC